MRKEEMSVARLVEAGGIYRYVSPWACDDGVLRIVNKDVACRVGKGILRTDPLKEWVAGRIAALLVTREDHDGT